MIDILAFCLDILRVARVRRRGIATLEALSDHCLADLGIGRSMIGDYVAACCPWPTRPASEQAEKPRVAPLLQGCG